MRFVMALLVVTGGLAAAAPTSTQMSESQCYDCHAPGLWSPPMAEPAIVEYRFVPNGTTWWLEADVKNTWTHEMRDLSGMLDTALHAGVTVLAQGNGTSETRTGSFEARLPPQEQAVDHVVEVPAQVQSLHIALRHDGRLTDLRLEVLAPGADEPCPGVRHNPQGASVTFPAEDLAGTGPGQWTVRVSREAGPLPEPVDYTLDVNIGLEPDGAAIAWAPDVMPGNVSTLRWPVALSAPDVAPLGLKLQYTSYYVHAGSEPDTEFLYSVHAVEVSSQGGTPAFPQIETESEDQAVPGVPFVVLGAALAVFAAWRRR